MTEPRYVTKRANKAGVTRWYWQRPGFPLARLPDDPTARERMAGTFNNSADSFGANPPSGDYLYGPADKYWRVKLPRLRQSAKTRGIPFALTHADLVAMVNRAKGRCEATGILFADGPLDRSGRNPFQPTVDRKDSAGPYAPGNCRLVCLAANIAINSWGPDVVAMLSAGILQNTLKTVQSNASSNDSNVVQLNQALRR